MPEAHRHVGFYNPPIEEVAMGVQFAPLDLTSARLGRLWSEQFRDRFPRVEDHQPLAHVVEQFVPPSPPQFEIKLLTEPPPPMIRVWLLSEDLHKLCQVQPDRFVRNWRRVEDRGAYPRYATLREAFEQDLARFEAGLASQGLGPIDIDQCELTYVDHLPVGKGLAGVSEVDKAVSVWSWPPTVRGLQPEEASFKAKLVLEDDDKQPIGRVHLQLGPGRQRATGKPLLILQTTARGRPRGSGSEGALAFFDRAHAAIVELFVSVTTTRMHELWGRHDDP